MIVMFQLKGRDITEEERKMLEEEGVNIPYNVVLTKVRRPGLSNLSKNANICCYIIRQPLQYHLKS